MHNRLRHPSILPASPLSSFCATTVEELLSFLPNPFNAQLLNYFEDKQCVYLVSELCLIDLDTYMKKVVRQPLSEGFVAEVAKSVVEGLVYLHSQGIMHRDLKPSNILLNQAHKAVRFSDLIMLFSLSTFGIPALLALCR